jgi:hypothetical protein
MNDVLTLDKAQEMVQFAEFFRIFWADWHLYTDVKYEALAYLVENSSKIILPNVKYLSEDKVDLLREYKGYLELGFTIN